MSTGNNEQATAANLVPGVMHCARCKFRVVRTILYVGTGAAGAGDSKTEPCPNGCGPLWPVTWEQEAREAWARAEEFLARAVKAESATQPLPLLEEVTKALGDLSFECFGVGHCERPSIGTYNRTFAVLYTARKYLAAAPAVSPPETLLRECHLSGQMSAAQSVVHFTTDRGSNERIESQRVERALLRERGREDANNYCRILTLLGMEEEGDPVAEVQRLVAASQPPQDERKEIGNANG